MDAGDRKREQDLVTANETPRSSGYRAHALLIAGMHRTGTSALTRVMNLRGLDLPRTLIPGEQNNNDLGFWEPALVQQAHDRFLESIGSAWDDVSPIPPTVFSSPQADEFAKELEQILRSEYGESTLFVVKDPRLCRLIPVWLDALESYGARPSFIITTRNPLEVAASLRARDGFSATKSCLLWLRHLLDAERDSRGFPRVFVSYENLLRNWVGTTDQIAHALHLFWARSDHATNLQIEDFLSSQLRHHSFDSSELQARSDVAEWVKQAYEAVSRAASDADEIDTELFDEIRGQVDRADQAYGPLLAQARAEISGRQLARDEAEAQLAASVERLSERETELQTLTADNQLITASLAEKAESVARLRRVADALRDTLAALGLGLGNAGEALASAEDGSSILRALREELRLGAEAREVPETVREAVDSALARIDAFLRAVDGDRADLLAARDASEAQLKDLQQLLDTAEAEKLEQAALLAAIDAGKAQLQALQQQLGLAESDKQNQADALATIVARAAAQLRDLQQQLDAAEAEKLNQADLLAAIAAGEAQLADLQQRFDSAEAERLDQETNLLVAIAAGEAQLEETQRRLESAEAETLSQATRLLDAIVAGDAKMEDLKRRLDSAEGAVADSDEKLASTFEEARQLATALHDRERKLARTSEEARQLAAALADSEYALARGEIELRERDELLARLDAIGKARPRRWRSFTQFSSWLLPPTPKRLGYIGAYLRLRRSDLFDADFYLSQFPDVSHTGLNPLMHYVEHGRPEGRPAMASPPAIGEAQTRQWRSFRQFSPWLLRPTPRRLGYMREYLRLRRRPDVFDADFYLSSYPDVAQTGQNPLMHYIEHGRLEGRSPVPPSAAPEPSEAVVDPAVAPELDAADKPALEDAAPEPSEAVVDPAVAQEFDAALYRDRYPDVTGTDADLLKHYMTHGWQEHRDPNAWFSTSYYLAHNDEILEAGLNPFVHFVTYGRTEGRLPNTHMTTKLLKGYEPTVSAIVPAFNHAPFLRQRIESIVAQDRPPTEIIILDDASTDGTRELIEQMRGEIDIPLIVELNDENSGNVFKQWRKGLGLATGDLVWICESDDFCSDDFLGRLVPYFADPSVTLAFGRIQYADMDGAPGTWLDEYRESAAAGYWDEPRIESAYQWFRGPFGRLNVIPNVGGCLFRRQALLEEVWEEAERYSVCGDWYLYMHIAGGGRIAFDPEAVSYFRQHGANTSVTSFAGTGYYHELASIAAELRRRYGVDDAQLQWLYDNALAQYRPNFPAEPTESFDQIFDLQALTSLERETRHVLIALIGFMTGGGEIFPINLANALVDRGYMVSVLVLDGEVEEPKVRARLRPEIPVYERLLVREIGLNRFLQDHGIDLVHSHNLWLDLFIHEACRETGVPLLATLHGSYEADDPGDETIASLVESVSRFVYTADKNLRPFDRVATDPAMFRKMANAVSDPEPGLRLSRKEFGIPDDAFVFGVASRAIRSKGWDIAANALQRVAADAERPVYVALCGDSDSYDDLLAELGGLPGVRFLGHQSNVFAFYRMCDCCLLPTRFPGESFPFTLLESLTAGTPIIATDIGEIRSIVESDGDAAGIVVPRLTDDDFFTAAFAYAMSRMLSERETFARGAERLAQKYSFENLTTGYEEHYAAATREGRALEPSPSPHLLTAADEVRRRVQPGPEFEEFDPQIAAQAPPRAKVVAFYLPQFHSIPENDEWWGKGFTEWSNVARGYPRFADHYQPRVPRDLGFYDLGHGETLASQVELARAAGIHGFSFYYYWFDGKRLLERPVERFLADSSIDLPFCVTWANENWTRRWDGYEDEILIAQSYDPECDTALVDDLQRYFEDPRYIRLQGRPLFLLYRIDRIPDAAERIERWRELWSSRHGEEPLIFMAHAFGSADPYAFGLDGAFEFPPHKLLQRLPAINSQLAVLDPKFSGHVVSYDDVVAEALAEPAAEYPLIRTASPSWDNDARRQGAGLTLHGSTPAAYERWLRALSNTAARQPIFGEPLVLVNAWNEWAEAAYLEPDVHYGAAYLNATARALCADRSSDVRIAPQEAPADEDPALVGNGDGP